MNAIDASKKARALVEEFGEAMYACGHFTGKFADYDPLLDRSCKARIALCEYIAQLESSVPALCPHDNARGYCAQCAGDKETRAKDPTLYGTEIVDPGRRE